MFVESVNFFLFYSERKLTKKQSTIDNLSNKFYLNFFDCDKKKFQTFLLHMHILCDLHQIKHKSNAAAAEAAFAAPSSIYVMQIKQYDKLKHMQSTKKSCCSTDNFTINWKTYLLYGRTHATECHNQQQ